MPNVKTHEEKREIAPGKTAYVRVAQRDKAVEMLATGHTVKQVSSKLKTSRQSVYRWLKEPGFNAKLREAQEMMAIDAISQSGALVGDAVANVRRGLANDDSGELGLSLLDKMGVLRTTGARMGMDAKNVAGDQGFQVVINVNPVDSSDSRAVVEAECVESEQLDGQNTVSIREV